MPLLLTLLGFLLGVILNHLADSLPHPGRISLPRCVYCSAPRPWTAWSGLLSSLGRGSACPNCSRRRGLRAPLVELLMILGALWLADRQPAAIDFWPALGVFFLFLLTAVIDIEHRLILHVVMGSAAGLTLLFAAINPQMGLLKTISGGVAGFVLVYLLYLLGVLFARMMARRRGAPLDEVAFGFGDVTLSGVIGLILGWPAVLVALFFGILAAGIFSLFFMLGMVLIRRYTPLQPIPYGPFLLLGASLVYYFPDLVRGALGG